MRIPIAASTTDRLQARSYLVGANIIGCLSKEMLVGGDFVAIVVQILAFSNAQISWFLAILTLIALALYPFLGVIRRYPRLYATRIGRALGLTYSC